jgi:hypothetical protein
LICINVRDLGVQDVSRMCGRSQTARSQPSRTGYRLSASFWLGVVVALFMAFVPGTAQACSEGATGGIARSVSVADKATIAHEKHATEIVHKAKHAPQLKVVAASTDAVVANDMPCCTGCGSAADCAGACSAAIDTSKASIDCWGSAGGYVPSPQREIFSLGPPPDFRPPRLLA